MMQVMVFDDFSLDVPAGKTVALCGQSGDLLLLPHCIRAILKSCRSAKI